MIRVLPILVLLLLAVGCRRPPPAVVPVPAPPPLALKYPDHNLVFISFDALQAAHVGHLGNPRNVTPTLDALAADGFTFTRTYSVASWTVPASMTWFTGVYPSEHKVVNKYAEHTARVKKPANLKELAPDLGTLADVLRWNGYATAGFTGNAGVSGGFGYQQGFDVYDHPPAVFAGFDQSVPKALAWLAANKDRKFFLFLHGYDAHGQNTPAKGFDYRFVQDGYDRRYTGAEVEQEALREEGIERGFLTLRESDVQFWRAVYDEKVQRADAKLGRFLAEYDKLGLTGKTLFVVTSDHGTELAEHRRLDHGFTLYDETIRVPLIVKSPEKAGVRIDHRVSSIDVMPTILDLLAVRVPENVRKQMRGQSLTPALRGEVVNRDLFAETDYRQHTYKRAVIAPDGWKLIYTLETNTRELYDTAADPGETTDLAAKHPDRADELQRRLFAQYKGIGHDLTARKWEPGFNPVYTFPAKPSPRE